MIILIDFSQLVISSMTSNVDELKGSDGKNFAKHIVLTQLLGIKSRHKGQVILCCDSSSYWRKTKLFPFYKGHRKHEKNKSDIDWEFIQEVMTEVKTEIRDNFPYKLLEVYGAEADDVIAVLCKYFQENELINSGLFEVPQDIIIVSTDKDFQQLQKYNNVKQWNNVKSSFLTCTNPKTFLIEHICSGDAGDNVPNICTTDEWAKCRAEGIKAPRANSFFVSRLPEFFVKGKEACKDAEERVRFERNEKLVNLDLIPDDIADKIITVYKSLEVQGSPMKVLNYLQQHRMRLLIADYTKF